MNIAELQLIESDNLFTGIGDKSIPVYDSFVLQTGTYYGRVKLMSSFYSRKRNIDYVSLKVGTKVRLPDDTQHIIEVDRVWYADYRRDSTLIKTLNDLGSIVDGKIHPDILENLPVQFTLKLHPHADENAMYKEYITDIKLVDKIPDDLDFRYVKVKNIFGYEFVPTCEPIQTNNTTTDDNKLSSDNDYLSDDDFEDD